jgi:nicotinamide-nucleotide adenylyltransferase
MHAALRRFFDPDGVDSRVICARRAIGLGKSNGESAILEAASEWLQADRVNIVDMVHGLQNLSSSEVRAKVRARDNTWREMVPNGIAEYIEEHSLYSNLT